MCEGQELSDNLRECGGGIEQHAAVIIKWLGDVNGLLSREDISKSMQAAFGYSFEADEALNRIHRDIFGSIIQE